MKQHILKIHERYARRLADGSKNYEIRHNDRDYQVGDLVSFLINSFEDSEWELPTYRITHVLQDVPEYGLKSGYCIISLKQVEK